MRPMISALRLFLFSIYTLLTLTLFAQKNEECKGVKPPINRLLNHENIDREQRNALRADGKADAFFYAGNNEDINFLVTQALTQKIDFLQCWIERDSAIMHRKKVAYLAGLEKMLKQFTANFRSRRINASSFPTVLEAYEAAINRDKSGESIERIISRSSYEVADMLVNSGAFTENAGYKDARNIVIRKYLHQHPEQTFYTLKQNPDVPFRDSLILLASYKYPHRLYDYAAANNKLGYAIRNINDPLIKTVVRMATSGGSGQLYFPFLDNILKGRQTIEEIDAVKGDDVKYYRLLVKTRMDYVQRRRQKDTVYEMGTLMNWVEKKARDVFINTINGLHEQPDPVRFRILQQLNAQELYYIAVSGENTIYTSSYVRGVYPIMMQKISNRGDSLILSVGFDRFKKFIRMAAGFNTLNNFLASFKNKEDATSLMTAFVNGLEKSSGLEDGVDVADSYVSIAEGNKELAKNILELTKINYDRNVANNNQRGMVMYNLLYKLFLSADTTNNIDLSKEFGIPPVYNVSYQSLAVDSQRVVMQVFFYGDKDGQNIFQGFLRQFSNGNWKITHSKQWVSIASTRGKPILIFANRPLPEETGADDEAQSALTEYLINNGMSPTIVVHRGHSYYANSTIERITPAAKIVFLGSCGGYHLIHDVLRHAPDAHIIASKQIGKTIINQPFFNILMEKLRNGSDINWIPFWHEFQRAVPDKDGFEDYIPPHKNLGAIFIKAYKSQMGDEDQDDE
ncbi:MAG: hypothetical protein ICV53_09360 [Flavisolibacter sp.]|nr:hypothetical protein [Flavisolibacter sp.]MBD0366294.1 hypothetical protein [Flavisolibacter sp.]